MCGITGIVFSDRAHPVDRDLVRRMTSTLAHRGPDADGYLFDAGAALGHRRLSIIDLSTGDQPIYNEDRTRAVVFNGEIYNFRELRAELQARGHRFATVSDTEVIVHAWEEYGDDCIGRFRGMFALALWDARRRRLLLARDRVGKKPLYYAHDGERLVFASELKAILVDPSVKRVLNAEAIDDYLSFGAVPAPRTIYHGLAQLPPAHYLVWEDGRVEVTEYWDLAFQEAPERSEASWLEELEAVIGDAVRLRMISDVPLGAFLSGGVDSSAVVAAMAAQSARPIATTTVAFNERAFNEAAHARAVAASLGTDHRELLVEPRAAEILPKLVWHLDEPFADSSALPTYYVSWAARQRVTVALSGDGGDEVFGGYEWRYRLNLLEHAVRRRLPRSFRRGVLAPMAAVWPKADRLPRPLRWKFFLRNVSLDREQAYFHDMSLFTPGDKQQLLSPDFRRVLRDHDPFALFARHFARARDLDPLSRILYVDTKAYLANDILVKVDRMAMANSLEVRSPLLDHKVMEFAATVPSRLKFRGPTSKYLLKRYVEQRVPPAVVHRPKMGFAIPLGAWLRTDLRPLAEDLLLSPRAVQRGYFSPERVRGLWDAHQGGRRDHAHPLWALMMLEFWHRLFVDQPVAPPADPRPGPGRPSLNSHDARTR
ncbi:MAG: asparagine synthase (glutamine-hydrolyzing) [Candidatus Rokuibacteriota bacterium]